MRIRRVNDLQAAMQEARKSKYREDAEIINGHLANIRDPRETGNLLDHTTLFNAIQFLPPLPEKPSADARYSQNLTAPEILQEDDLTDSRYLDLLKFNIDQGVPVILGTKGAIKGFQKAMYTGTPTNHAVGVLRPAQIKKGHSVIEGVLIYDPYGDSLDAHQNLEKYTDSVTSAQKAQSDQYSLNTKVSGQAVRFVAYEDFGKYFCKAAIASGGYSAKHQLDKAKPESGSNHSLFPGDWESQDEAPTAGTHPD